MSPPNPGKGGDATELVVLVDESGNAVGTAVKNEVHHQDTPLHLAFSCYVFDDHGRLLVTRRATHKPTFPGVWTNSLCGHPGPDEDILEAIRRRARQELGITLRDLTLALPSFRYVATMGNGVRENELCPVFVAVTGDEVHSDPDEVDAAEWVSWPAFQVDVLVGRREVSPWCAAQLAQLSPEEPRVTTRDGSAWAALPPAARRRQAG